MEVNYLIVGITVAVAIVIVVVAIIRNQRDKANLEKRLNNDYIKDEEFESELNDENN